MKNMTYRQLLLRLSKMSQEDLDREIQIYDCANDCYCDVRCFANDMDEFHPADTDSDCIIID